MTETNSYEEGDIIIITDEEGNEEKFKILFSFYSEAFNKNYVLYYPTAAEEEEEVELLASSFIEDEKGDQGQLQPVETDEEWDMIEEILSAYLDEEDEKE